MSELIWLRRSFKFIYSNCHNSLSNAGKDSCSRFHFWRASNSTLLDY